MLTGHCSKILVIVPSENLFVYFILSDLLTALIVQQLTMFLMTLVEPYRPCSVQQVMVILRNLKDYLFGA